MSDPSKHWSDRKHFYDGVLISLLDNLESIENVLLSSNIKDELFERALKIGYDMQQSKTIRQIISNRYMDRDHHPIQIELPENDYCETALAQIIQERINNSEVFEEDVIFLDQLLARYDPILPDDYLEPIPDDIHVPVFESNDWIENIDCELPANLDPFDWVTLYSDTNFHLKNFDIEGVETESISTLLLSTEKIPQYQANFDELTIADTINSIPLCKTLVEFKKLPTSSNYNKIFSPLIIVMYNHCRLHSSNTLVRLDRSFLDQNNLKWDAQAVLDLTLNGSKIARYQLWAGPFDGHRYSRNRIASGVRLQIKKDFLKHILKVKNMSLFMINEKERRLVKPGINKTDTINSKKLKKHSLYSNTLASNHVSS